MSDEDGELERALRGAWSAQTCDDPARWTAENPAAGQCGVTALVVRALLGGEILLAAARRDGVPVERHACGPHPVICSR